MRVVQISKYDSGGAGKAAYRLHSALEASGIESKMLVCDKTSRDDDVVRINQSSLFMRICQKIYNKKISLELERYQHKPKEIDVFSDHRTIYNITGHPLIKGAEIINLHWIARMFNHNDFFSKMRGKQIVWTLHDMNPFTGGCHYAGGCKKYETGCGACPQLSSKSTDDLSRKLFKTKEKAYQGHKIYIVTPSKWLSECAKKSLLFKNYDIQVIPHSLPVSVFVKRDKQYSRNLFNLPQDKTIICFGADCISGRKGFSYLTQALTLLKGRINVSKAGLAVFGRYRNIEQSFKDTGFTVYQLGFIQDELLLACLYSAVDMFVLPSLEENLPNVVMEAFACGTPVVAFETGGISDMVKPHETGLLAKKADAEELAGQIEWMVNHPEEREQMGLNARKLTEEEYTFQIQAKRYLDLYKNF